MFKNNAGPNPGIRKSAWSKLVLLGLLPTLLVFQNCRKTRQPDPGPDPVVKDTTHYPNLPAQPYNYLISYPAHIATCLLQTDNTPADNPITNDGATLGRVLFYDKNLSINRTVSCGSCHKQAASFDDDAALSKGFDGTPGGRNAMAVLNVRFYQSGKMFWDERAATLEKQALGPIQNPVEMGMTLAELESRVRSLPYYPALFTKAFGSAGIDSVKIAKALAQFERSIVTYQAKYDRVKQGLESFTTLEAQGEQLFVTAPPPAAGAPPAAACSGCHAPPMFVTSSPAGPFAFPVEAGINGQNRFKSGSLRNIGVRSFLFHNGTVKNLNAMLTAGQPGTGTNPIPAHSIRPQDVAAITAFLNTLTDDSVTVDKKFSDPF